ncbi:hypothetical protein Dimus_025953 [Dionaea muscipula]
MDSIVHSALEEICSQAANGILLTLLWPKLVPAVSSAGLHPCDTVKATIWANLLKVPALQFRAQDTVFEPFDSRIQSFEDCEELNLRIVAGESLRDCFLGLYDCQVPDSGASPQRKVLERLAIARTNGVTQKQLSDELGIRGNNFFYVVKTLECRGLIVRQSTILRKKEALSNATSAPVTTNLIRLHRYALPLGSQQKLDITVEKQNPEENARETVDNTLAIFEESCLEDVHVKDYLPAMKAVCDRLEQADGKVLLVSDIKRELGYRETAGHRAWRNICGRLKQAGLVEVFDAKVEDDQNDVAVRSLKKGKPVSCLRLMKKFSLKLFEPRTSQSGSDGTDSEQLLTSGRRGQNTEQLLELPIEQQIFDMIDAEGSKGLVAFELCKRLGISNKKNHNRLSIMSSKFGLVQLPENHKRGTVYRCWTPRNFGRESNKFLPSVPEHPRENRNATASSDGLANNETPQAPDLDFSVDCGNQKSSEAEEEPSCLAQPHGNSSQMALTGSNQHSVTDLSISVPDVDLSLIGSLETSSRSLPKPVNTQLRCRYPSVTSAQREQRILEKLKEEKIILRCELQRWLESLEGGNRKIDRKTINRCLKKLEEEGHCKVYYCVVPGVTNYGHHRDITAVLHPSVGGDDLPNQVHERQRRFDMQTRAQASSHFKNELPVPILNGIEKVQTILTSDAQGVKSEAMCSNGFILAKMARVRLLHNFLWAYVNDSTTCNESLQLGEDLYQSANPHSSCKLFCLDAAVKAMPLELFLQIVGSAQNCEDMIEKCKRRLLLSDLPKDEYKCIIDTQATGRLSRLIDILRRLKLIRMVANGSLKEGAKSPHATLVHALELKPYIEEPSNPLPVGSSSLDLRPHFRHDFLLSTREAVHKYWQTLEYCYAAADPEAALHAFPGCYVHNVFHPRSWTTVRVMTTEQRAELQKRLSDAKDKKLTIQDCREIAKDLNLNFEQVLRVYYDKKRRNRFQGATEAQDDEFHGQGKNSGPISKKRKISSDALSSNRLRVDHGAECDEDHLVENVEEPDFNEEQEQHSSSINQCDMPRGKQTRQGKFSWTEEADRQLLIQYARQRAVQGARRGTDWASISDLPASLDTCRRRIAILRKDINFTKALMRLCNLLSQRYALLLDKNPHRNSFSITGCGQGTEFQIERWDNFDDPKIKLAFDEVLMCKQILRLDATKSSGVVSEGAWRTFSSSTGDGHDGGQHREPRQSCYRLPCKFVKHLKGEMSIVRQVSESLAVSSAVELFKLIFLSSSKAAMMPNLLAETLRCYSEHDLFSAFVYLRQKKIMVGSIGSKPFALSQHFLQNVSTSQFPTNTGKRATKFACWISERETDLMEGMVKLTSDLQCGDILHLFSLVASGELSVSPLLPEEGFGEAEDSRSSKRKFDDSESGDVKRVKKQKFHLFQESEIFSRREKGFPGLFVSLSRSNVSRFNMIEFFKDIDKNPISLGETDAFYSSLGQKISSSSQIDYKKEASDFGRMIPVSTDSGMSFWEVMSNYAEKVFVNSSKEQIQVYPEMFQTAYTAIQKAGDQGLSLPEVSTVINMHGIKMAENVVNVLQAFEKVLKVNSYDSVRVVDVLYRSKYFLTSKVVRAQNLEMVVPPYSLRGKNGQDVVKGHWGDGETVSEKGMSRGVDEVHKVTILNLSDEVHQQSDTIQTRDRLDGYVNGNIISTGGREDENLCSSSGVFSPILPWINGDGTINGTVYRGLTRRILGIVMQNPGILEEKILHHMDVLNPQSCRQLLELMILDNHIIVRKMHQTTSFGPPALFKSLRGSRIKNPVFVSREHYFANTMSAALL